MVTRRNVEWVVETGDDLAFFFDHEASAASFAARNAPSRLLERWEEPEGFRNAPTRGMTPTVERLVREYK